MAVAKNQIEEVLDVVRRHVDDEALMRILMGLARTVAFKKNRSFCDTIERLVAAQRAKRDAEGSR
jgi:hypothetical protein